MYKNVQNWHSLYANEAPWRLGSVWQADLEIEVNMTKTATMGEHCKKNVFATTDYVKKIRLVIVTRN